MTTETFLQPDYASQAGSDYPTKIDKAIAVLAEYSAQFAVHESATPAMSVEIGSGVIWNGGTAFSENAGQTLSSIVAPGVNPRKDLVVLDPTTGAASIISGTEAASPVLPAVAAGKVPLAWFQLETGTTAIYNTMINPVRPNMFGAVMKGGNQSMAGDLAVGGSNRTWSGANAVLDLGDSTAMVEFASGTSQYLENLRWDGSNYRYIIDGFGSFVSYSINGDIIFNTAPTGTAGNIATTVERFKIAADGTVTAGGNQVWHKGNSAIKFKAATESISSSTTLQDDNHLIGWNLEPGKWYRITGKLQLEASSTGRFRAKIVCSSLPSVIAETYHYTNSTYDARQLISYGLLSERVFETWYSAITIDTTIKANASIGGTLKLQWAQKTSDASGTVLRAGSWMEVTEIG